MSNILFTKSNILLKEIPVDSFIIHNFKSFQESLSKIYQKSWGSHNRGYAKRRSSAVLLFNAKMTTILKGGKGSKRQLKGGDESFGRD